MTPTGPFTQSDLHGHVNMLCGPSTGDDDVDLDIVDEMIHLLIHWGYATADRRGAWLHPIDVHIFDGFLAHACEVVYARRQAEVAGHPSSQQPDRATFPDPTTGEQPDRQPDR